MTVESFLTACKKANLSVEELDYLTIGMCLDYAYEFAGITEEENENGKGAIRKANQRDFDLF